MPSSNSYYKILLGINDAKNTLGTLPNRVLNIESPENLRFLAANYGINAPSLFIKHNVPGYSREDILINISKSFRFWLGVVFEVAPDDSENIYATSEKMESFLEAHVAKAISILKSRYELEVVFSGNSKREDVMSANGAFGGHDRGLPYIMISLELVVKTKIQTNFI